MEYTPEQRTAWFRQMLTIRLFEDKVQELYLQGLIPGTTHLCQGQEAEAIAAALADEMRADPSVVLLGEDVGQAGGPFKTSEGLFSQFGPSRVIDTPIAENGFLGAALGMAVTGLRPVAEIMFSDFLPVAGDALVNEIPKFRFMSGGQRAASMPCAPLPFSPPLEDAAIPGVERIAAAVRASCGLLEVSHD
jgi:pyruvate dehydrogenase E1 component beta subunit